MHSRMESYVSQGSNQKKKKKRSLAKGEMVPPKSLNSHVRTKEQKRIREENKRNRERMNTLRPTSELSRSGMRKDRLQREKYLGNISRTRQKEKKYELMQKRLMYEQADSARSTSSNSYFSSKKGGGTNSLPSLHSTQQSAQLHSSPSASQLPPLSPIGAVSFSDSKQVRFG